MGDLKDDLFSPSLGATERGRTPNARGGSREDLYAPSLDESHDATNIQPPWRPNALLIPTFFGGGFTGAILYGFNARFLDRARDARWIVPLFCTAGIAVAWITLEVVARANAGAFEDYETVRRTLRFGTRFGVLLIALFVGHLQKSRYRLYREEDRPLWLPGLGAVLAGWALNLVFVLLIAAAFGYSLSDEAAR